MEDAEREKMGLKKLQEEDFAFNLKAELRTQFPTADETQLEAIVALRLKALLSSPKSISQILKPIDLGDDKELSLNFKGRLLTK